MVETHTLRFLELVQRLVAKNYRESHLGLENVRSLCALDVAYKGDLGVAVAVREEGGAQQGRPAQGCQGDS